MRHFTAKMVLGPSLWFKDKLLVNQVSNTSLSFNKRTKFYMASGELDLRIKEYQEEFVELLQEKHISNLSIQSEVIQNETHRTIFGVGFTKGLRFIYGE